MRAVTLWLISLLALSLTASVMASDGSLQDSLASAERSFSKSMVDRDFKEFSSHIAEDAIFINGGKPLRGKKQILDHWRKFFEAKEAPFEWDPEIAEPVESGSLGYTEGPVRLMNGKQIARFYSTWRRDSSGTWKVVFDNGYDLCSCEQKP